MDCTIHRRRIFLEINDDYSAIKGCDFFQFRHSTLPVPDAEGQEMEELSCTGQ